MHEHGIADRLFEQIFTLARLQRRDTFSRVKIGIGALSGMDAEALREALDHVAGHFEMDGIAFSFEQILPAASCPKCNIPIGQAHACPVCGNRAITITAGLDVEVLEIEA
jgi:Zn finger protein HypA/HybF involved in hydrogenase expression